MEEAPIKILPESVTKRFIISSNGIILDEQQPPQAGENKWEDPAIVKEIKPSKSIPGKNKDVSGANREFMELNPNLFRINMNREAMIADFMMGSSLDHEIPMNFAI
ncbi:unnamed protein product [Ilex paraguariensis]|uniref:Uncharacterized protein n=1 Tax=Ilex paraguariensis TaxID=185542 RepID=A0ABC8TVJ2_9AQUA